jgi:hypothetical protein
MFRWRLPLVNRSILPAVAIALCLNVTSPNWASEPKNGATIALTLDHQAKHQRLTVQGLPLKVLQELTLYPATDPRWTKLFSVTVHDAPTVNMLGRYGVDENLVVFRPRYPFRPNTDYRAEFHARLLPGLEASGQTVSLEFSLRHTDAEGEPARVSAVYPSANQLPENLLRFYVHFSRPMSRGQAYRCLHLLDASGNRIEDPFLELGEELWDDAGQRFTLFFDPGRVKRGLKPREEVGPVLEAGRTYTLVVDSSWRDARGQPMEREFRKTFHTVPIDDLQPSATKWKLKVPRAGTRAHMTVMFDESLDHGMLERVLTVESTTGSVIAGKSTIEADELGWKFYPTEPWAEGDYRLRIETILEDVAGNSLARPFEVDVFRQVQRKVAREFVTLPFSVRSTVTANQ